MKRFLKRHVSTRFISVSNETEAYILAYRITKMRKKKEKSSHSFLTNHTYVEIRGNSVLSAVQNGRTQEGLSSVHRS